MRALLIVAFLLLGTTFMLLAAVGVVRLPDLFMRMQATSKAVTLGVACVLVASALHFAELGIVLRAAAVIAFFFVTVPVSAHMLGRAAYFVGVPMWEGTTIDELRGLYDPDTHELGSVPTHAGPYAHELRTDKTIGHE